MNATEVTELVDSFTAARARIGTIPAKTDHWHERTAAWHAIENAERQLENWAGKLALDEIRAGRREAIGSGGWDGC